MPDTTVTPIASFHDYEVAFKEHIQLWLDTYLAVRERFVGITPGAISRPRSWFQRQDYAALPGYESTPAVIVVSTGTVEEPHQHGDGKFDVLLRFAILTLVHATEADAARALAGHYQAAMTMLCLRQKVFGSPPATWNRWLGFFLDDVDNDQERTLASVRLEMVYKIRDFASASGGPLTVPIAPHEPIPDLSTVETPGVVINP